MYNFLVENNLCVANFRDKQEENYTYRKGSVVSYIDHVFIPEYTVSAMNKCVIRHNDANNVSDHLALCMDMELIPHSDNSDKTDCNINPVPYLPRLNWQDTNYQRRYCELLKESLDQISRSTYDLSEINKGSAVVFVNNLYNVICSTIHDVTKKCANEFNERKTHGAKQWWTKECTLARNRNRLFFHLWKSVGRPSEGATYNCYKEARRNYRRICRQAVKKGYSYKFNLMNKLFRENKAGQMWNLVRKQKAVIIYVVMQWTLNALKPTLLKNSHLVSLQTFREKPLTS